MYISFYMYSILRLLENLRQKKYLICLWSRIYDIYRGKNYSDLQYNLGHSIPLATKLTKFYR